MNKKVLTLCAGLLLAGSAVAANPVIGGLQTSTDGLYKAVAVSGSFDSFKKDASSWNRTDFPKVSPFEIKTANGAKPIYKLDNTDGQTDSRYFQFVVGSSTTSTTGGKEVLTMVWVKGNNGEGHYEIQVELKIPFLRLFTIS